MLKKLNKNLTMITLKIKERAIKTICNEDGGEGIITGIIFAAIVILAIIATQTDIQGAFTDIAANFRTWVTNKVSSILS